MRRSKRLLWRFCLTAVVALATGPAADAAGGPSQGSRADRVVEQVTYASWYGRAFARRPTASGELFNPMALTAAHRTLPLGTRVRVTNLRNGRTVVVRINDRGPYHRNRGLDVSREAARRLRMVDQGVARVRIETLPAGRQTVPLPTASDIWPSAPDGPRAIVL